MRMLGGGMVAIAMLAATAVAVRAQSCPPQCPSGKVPLGLAMPMSGPPATFGRPAAKAVEIGVSEINAAGGVLGTPVELVIGDDRCDAGMATRVAKRHIEYGNLKFVIGPICPAVAMDAAPIYAQAGVVQIVPTVTTVELTRLNLDNIFRMAATDEQEAQAFGAYLDREQRGKKLTVVYGDFFYRRTMADLLKDALPSSLKESAQFELLKDVPGASVRLAEKLRRDPADIIYLSLGAEQFLEFVGALRAQRVKSVLIGGQHMLSQGFWSATHAAAEGVLVVVAPIESNDPHYLSASDLLKRHDVVPDLVALYSYAAVQVWVEAVRRAGDGDPKKVIAALRSGEFATAVGRVAFDSKGDRRDVRYSVLTWQGGRLIEMQTADKTPQVTPVPTAPPQAAGLPAMPPPDGELRFKLPVPFGPFPVYGNSIEALADSVPLFPPLLGLDEAAWKKPCSNCHKWDQQTLCQQGASYVANPRNVLRIQHPFGGPFKVALMRWAKGGCL